MALPTRPAARRRALAILTATATAAGGAALLGPGTSSASSHREAPYTLSDPLADNTDTYAFVSPDDPDSVTLIANWIPFQEPGGGPNFYPWDDKARYEIHIDNDGDARPDITYRWQFKDIDNRGGAERGANDGTFLYNDGPVSSFDDATLKFKQTYTLTAITTANDGTQTAVPIVSDGKSAPSNVGKASMPDYQKLREEAITTTAGGGKSFAGQVDDPFFLDLRIFDLLYGGDLSEVGFDTLAEYNVNTVALQLPKRLLVANGDPAANPVIGVWSTTSRAKTQVLKSNNATPTTGINQDSDTVDPSGDFVQVSRLGNPLVNEAVVPSNLKDFFNRSTPDTDGKFLPKVQDPEVPILVESVYKIPNPNKLDREGASTRNDLVAAFLTGFSERVHSGATFGGAGKNNGVNANLNSLDLNAVSPNPVPAEYLRLNVQVPPKSPGQTGFSRLGAVGGDLSGFPNGRRLQDDVVDIALQVLEGVLIRPDGDLKTAVAGLGDAVNANENFRTNPLTATFPYIANPHSGSDPRKGATPVRFQQNFTSENGVVTATATRITPVAKGGFAQLYRINADGSETGLGSSAISADGTATVVKRFPVARGTRITLNWRVFPARGSAAQENRGIPTTITVR